MAASEQSGTVPEGARSHAVNLTGTFFGDLPVLARAGFILDSKPSVTLKIAVRSKNPQVTAMLTNAIR
jgi:protein-disulfide isomerase-like protein with CxxC motif